MYQPTLGRFLSRDPLSADGVDVISNTGWFGERLEAMRDQYRAPSSDDRDLYRYVSNNPVMFVDPSGLSAENPGWVCLNKNCTNDMIITDENGVWDRIAPGECCKADGVWRMGGQRNPSASASVCYKCTICTPPNDYMKVGDWCTIYVSCDAQNASLYEGKPCPVPWGRFHCKGFWANRYQAGLNACGKPSYSDHTPNRHGAFPADFNPEKDDIPPRGKDKLGMTCGQRKDKPGNLINYPDYDTTPRVALGFQAGESRIRSGDYL